MGESRSGLDKLWVRFSCLLIDGGELSPLLVVPLLGEVPGSSKKAGRTEPGSKSEVSGSSWDFASIPISVFLRGFLF